MYKLSRVFDSSCLVTSSPCIGVAINDRIGLSIRAQVMRPVSIHSYHLSQVYFSLCPNMLCPAHIPERYNLTTEAPQFIKSRACRSYTGASIRYQHQVTHTSTSLYTILHFTLYYTLHYISLHIQLLCLIAPIINYLKLSTTDS